MSRKITQEQLENLLSMTLVPVEPSEVFVKRLRASLVKVHGRKPFSIWTGLAVLGSLLLVIAMLLGVILRFFLAGVGLLNLLAQRQSYRNSSRSGAGAPLAASRNT